MQSQPFCGRRRMRRAFKGDTTPEMLSVQPTRECAPTQFAADRDEQARDFANHEWLTDRESFERIPTL